MRVDDSIDVEYIGFYDASAGTVTARTLTGDDLFPDSFDVGDRIIFCGTQSEYWRDISISVDVAIAADSVTGKWVFPRYRSGDYWVDMGSGVVDGTSGFTSTGSNNITFDLWDVSPWGKSDTVGKYFIIAYEITAVTNPTEGGHFDARPTCKDCAVYVESTDSVTLEEVYDYVATNATSKFLKKPVDDDQMAFVGSLRTYSLWGKIEVESGGTLNTSNSVIEIYSVGYVQIGNKNWIWCKSGGTWNWGSKNTSYLYGQGGGFFGCTVSSHPNDRGYIKIDGTANWYGVNTSVMGTVPNFYLNGTLNAEDLYFDLYFTTMNGWDMTNITTDYGIYFRTMKDSYGVPMNVEYTTPSKNLHFYNLSGYFEVDSAETVGGVATSRFEDCTFRKVAFLCGYGGDAAPVIQIVDGEVWDGYSDGTGGDSQVYYRLYSGWEVQRRITLTDISVIDDSNTAISGATVKIYSAGGSELASGTTDASGEIADQEVIAYEFDNDTGSEVTYQSSTNLNSATTDNIPLRIVVSKAGYDDSTRYVSSYKGPFKVGKITLYKKSGGVKTVSAGILNYGQGN